MGKQSTFEGVQASLKDRPKFIDDYLKEHTQSVQEFIEGITNPVLPTFEGEKVVVPERPQKYLTRIYTFPIEGVSGEVYQKNDVAIVQLEDIGEKIVNLTKRIEEYKSSGPEGRHPTQYRQLQEASIKYAIQLDRVNVIDRNKAREVRRKMLSKLDKLSTDIVKTVEN